MYVRGFIDGLGNVVSTFELIEITKRPTTEVTAGKLRCEVLKFPGSRKRSKMSKRPRNRV